mmetsp:Transcript_55625/g.136510  ORF Transcript_55625/g.136510 Transcript_55625/m.136510 type:complete len:412 (+) Transcript_55625:187-1422(+)
MVDSTTHVLMLLVAFCGGVLISELRTLATLADSEGGGATGGAIECAEQHSERFAERVAAHVSAAVAERVAGAYTPAAGRACEREALHGAVVRACTPLESPLAPPELFGGAAAIDDAVRERLAWIATRRAEEYDAAYNARFDKAPNPSAAQDPRLPWSHARFDALGPVGPRCAHALESYGKGDEEKRVCALSRIVAAQRARGAECVVLSVGGNNEWGFELAVLARTPCRIVTVDCTIVPRVPAPLRDAGPSRFGFLKVCLGARTERVGDRDFVSWRELQRMSNATAFAHVKMDIEGFEWPVLSSMLRSLEPHELPGQLSVEVHYRTQFPHLPWYGRNKALGEIGALADALFVGGGYMLADRHDNPYCKHCSEVVWARVACWTPATTTAAAAVTAAAPAGAVSGGGGSSSIAG